MRLMKTLLAAGVLIMTAQASLAETVTLQQGQDGYSGCTVVPINTPESGKKGEGGPDVYLKAGEDRLLVRFELPADAGKKKLVRARLELFVKGGSDVRGICEVIARPVTQSWSASGVNWTNAAPGQAWQQPGGSVDSKTDFSRGRAAGVLDSFSLWQNGGAGWLHRYSHLALPKEGRWIDFNITPLAAKWLKDAAGNHGLMLETISQPALPNKSNLAIARPTDAKAELRPRLVLEFEPVAKPYLVGMTHTLDRFCDRDTRFRFLGPFDEKYELAMARNEFEGFQVLVYPLAEPLAAVSFDWTDLEGPDGSKIPKADIQYFVPEVFGLYHNKKVDDYFGGKDFELPDPLTTARPMDLPLHMSSPFWFNVRTRGDTKAGLYKGKLTVKPANAQPRELELSVRVWNYAIPEQWNFQTMGQMIWANVAKAHGQVSPELRRKYVDFLIDHRFAPTEQYANVLSPAVENGELAHCLKRGVNIIYLSGNYRFTDQRLVQLKERYEQIKKMGLLDMALVYIGDETNDWAEMRRRSDSIRLACPELMIMIGGSYPRQELDGVIDIFDPELDTNTGVFNITADKIAPLVAASQAKGERFFWYVCAGPFLPCPNVQMEEPLIASRAMFWMTWKFGVTGFEYYCYNIGWEHSLDGEGKKRWPEQPLSPRAFKWNYKGTKDPNYTNGDGLLFYPGPDGPFSTVRFENIRDGIEDWESHYVLRDCVEALQVKLKKDGSLAARAQPLLAKGQELLKVPEAVCKLNFTDWTWEPEALLSARKILGETIEQLASLVTEDEMLAVRAARKAQEVQRQRAMLADRAAAAQKAAATRPASGPASGAAN